MLRDTREIYRPFEYPEFEKIHNSLRFSFWHEHEITFGEDVNDFKNKLSEDERTIITRILKNFVQSEIHIGSFWGDFVSSWFKKPEIQNVARYISGAETTHAAGYDRLNTELNLNDYAALKEDKKLYARVQMLTNKKARTNEEILKQLFLYSVMGEGVSLFSSFLTIFAYTEKNLLKNTGQIVSWSSLDENLHSEVGCHLFNIFNSEYKIINKDIKKELMDIADEVVEIEYSLIDRVFEGVSTNIISPDVIKNYVNHRANEQLSKVALKGKFKVDNNLLEKTLFFDTMLKGNTVQDFFSGKETEYSKGIVTFDDVWENINDVK